MAKFTNGNKASAGVPKPTAGRPPDWLKEKCRDLVDKRELVEFIADVAAGKDMEQVVTENGDSISVPAAIKERLKACEILLSRGWGRIDDGSVPKSVDESVRNAENAMKVLKQLESYGQVKNARS